jgi:Zn-dependent metalloprotease
MPLDLTGRSGPPRPLPCIVPPYVLRRLAERGSPAQAEWARRALAHDAALRAARAARPYREASLPRVAPPGAAPRRLISSAANSEELPGTPVRREGEPPIGDPAADEAYDGFGATYALFAQAYGRDSIDGAGGELLGTVHYGRSYPNAFWDGTRMVFGDGDGELLGRMTVAVDVIGHELAHGVTEASARLEYQGQPGALNESVSDVFGVLTKQHLLGQPADAADWLIGAGLLLPAVQGVALRSMKDPGTAYDDDVLGKDPQPAHMDGYVTTTEDNGGVHINSGIPNRAFYLAATALGGNAWERAGAIWYATLTGPDLSPTTDFAGFAAATVAAAGKAFGPPEVDAVRQAWAGVGVDVPDAV